MILYDLEGADLSTGTPATSAFTPNASQWRTGMVDISVVLGSADVLLMFQNESNYGNNVYIDDIRISNTVGIAEAGAASFGVFPNPNTDAFSILFNGTLSGVMDLRVLAVDASVVQQRNWSAAPGAILDVDLGSAASAVTWWKSPTPVVRATVRPWCTTDRKVCSWKEALG